MRTFYLVLFIVLSCTLIGYGQTGWVKQEYQPDQSPVSDVFFINETMGWIVGSNGLILHTKNGGTDWATQSSTVTTNLNSAYFINDSTGWVVGLNGVILHTTNGGEKWTAQVSNTSSNLLSVHFAEAIGWIAGDEIILKSDDFGGHWVDQGNGLRAYDIFFIDSLRGWATQTDKIIYTTNGGGLWNTVRVFPEDYSWLVRDGELGSTGYRKHPIGAAIFASVQFTDALNGWISGYTSYYQSSYPAGVRMFGTIQKTNDGGRTWIPALGVGVNRPFHDIFFTDSEKGWAVGENMIYHTKDHGTSWIAQDGSSDTQPRKVHFTKSAGWIVGDQHYASRGLILKSLNEGGEGRPIPMRPLAPTNLVGTLLTGAGVDLTWNDNADNEDGYSIQRSKDSGSFYQISIVPSNEVSFRDNDITPGTYRYRVIAVSSLGGLSDFSNVSGVYVEDTGGYENFDLLYPNPTDGMLHIKLKEPLYNVELTVANSLGAIVKEFRFSVLEKGEHSLNMSYLPVGVYILVVKSYGKDLIRKFVKATPG